MFRRDLYTRDHLLDAQDGQGGVWTASEKAAEAKRREEAQAAKAAQALAEMVAKIDTIRANTQLTDLEKLRALRRLTASGYSDDEFQLLREAQESG
jgi:hypothetical protein